MLYKATVFKRSSVVQTLELGDVILHTRPEWSVVDFGTSKAKGDWFLVSYADNPGAEGQLSDREMDEILAHRITVT